MEPAEDETEVRQAIRSALHKLDASTEQALLRELAKPFDLGHSGRLQFEIDPWSLRISLIQTEEDLLANSAVIDLIPEGILDDAEAAGLDSLITMSEELVTWFAGRWQAVGGPSYYTPAYAFFHGRLGQPRYDLEQRRWCSVEEIWPEESVR